MTTLADIFLPRRGITSVIGSGGKSTLLRLGGKALVAAGRTVALATSTHMAAPHTGLANTLDELRDAISREGIGYIGEVELETGKLVAPACGIDVLRDIADHVLVEADGSKRRPLKAHAPHEPVIARASTRTILVVGASGLGLPIDLAVHRPETFCMLTEAEPSDPATPELVARAIKAEGFIQPDGNDAIIVNQADLPQACHLAQELAMLLLGAVGANIYIGSLASQRIERVH